MEFVERNHFSHPQHKLVLEKQSKDPFECNGCHQNGVGPRFNCSICKFNLHTHCANTIPTSDALCHHFHQECKFKFHLSPPGDSPLPCNACGQDVKGFVYYCERCKHALHPCCAALPRVIKPKDDLPLHLHRDAVASCDWCGQKNKKNKSWSYRSACESYNFHVTCVMEMWLKHPKELSFDGGGSNGKLSSVMQSNFSIATVKSNEVEKKRKKKLKNYFEFAAIVLRVIIAAVFGDPTQLIVAAITALQS